MYHFNIVSTIEEREKSVINHEHTQNGPAHFFKLCMSIASYKTDLHSTIHSFLPFFLKDAIQVHCHQEVMDWAQLCCQSLQGTFLFTRLIMAAHSSHGWGWGEYLLFFQNG